MISNNIDDFLVYFEENIEEYKEINKEIENEKREKMEEEEPPSPPKKLKRCSAYEEQIMLDTHLKRWVTKEKEHYISTHLRQLGKGQDIALFGKNQNDAYQLCDWLALFDGHGDNTFVNMITRIIENNILHDIIAEDDPIDEFVKNMKKIPLYNLSGSTGIFVKICDNNEITCWSVGDSQVAIFVNGQQVYISCPHNMKNPLEQERLAEKIKTGRVIIEKHPDLVPECNTKTTMITRPAVYIKHSYRVRLAMSQAFGNDWATDIVPEIFTYKFNPEDDVRVVAGSDGYWDHHLFDGPDAAEDLKDITTLSAEQLVDKMEQRWKQDWKYYWDPNDLSKFEIVNYDGQYDDISLAIWSTRQPIIQEKA
jgi:serine/threonine protein phosphatase PrpC